MNNQILVTSKKQWRDWLRKNHKTKDNICLVSYKKHTGKPSISHKEAMDEAICFGWIDTTVKRLDENKYQRCFVKRKKNASWSNATQSYAKELIGKRKMCKAGLEAYKLGLKKPTIDHNLPKNPDIPEEMKRPLGKDLEKFESLAPSTKKLYIYMFIRSKRKETKEKKIKEIKKLLSSQPFH